MKISMNGKMIKLGKKGPGSREGMFLGANDEFLVLYFENEGVVYYNLHHVKSFSERVRGENEPTITLPEGSTFVEDFTFNSLLELPPYKWIRIHLGGHDVVEGIFDTIDDNFITLIFHEEIIRVSKYHVKSISLEDRAAKQNEENERTQQKEQKEKGSKNEGNEQEGKTEKRGNKEENHKDKKDKSQEKAKDTKEKNQENLKKDSKEAKSKREDHTEKADKKEKKNKKKK